MHKNTKRGMSEGSCEQNVRSAPDERAGISFILSYILYRI